MKRIAICISTYKRPRVLGRLLVSISKLRLPRNKDTDIRVVVVDNDAEASARDIVQQERGIMPWPVIYDVEPQRGISFARNKTVVLSRDVDFVAFIDDDEEADPLWLDELLDVQQRYQADIVLGPVVPRFETSIPDWIAKARALEYHPRFKTGSKPQWLSTSNALVDRPLLNQLDGPFDSRFAMTGGEDGHLFKRLVMLGARSVWADDALIMEYTPASRATLGWIISRAYSIGIRLTLIEGNTFTSRIWPLKVITIGFSDIILGISIFIPSLFLGKYRIVKSLWHIMIGLGMLTGLMGFEYEEYKKIH